MPPRLVTKPLQPDDLMGATRLSRGKIPFSNCVGPRHYVRRGAASRDRGGGSAHASLPRPSKRHRHVFGV